MVSWGCRLTRLLGLGPCGAVGNVGIAPVRKYLVGLTEGTSPKESIGKQDFIEEVGGGRGKYNFWIVCSSHPLLHLYESYNFK